MVFVGFNILFCQVCNCGNRKSCQSNLIAYANDICLLSLYSSRLSVLHPIELSTNSPQCKT